MRAQLRAGYAGHVTIIANQLAAAAARRPAVNAALKAHAAWQSYVVHELGPRNEVWIAVRAVHSGCELREVIPCLCVMKRTMNNLLLLEDRMLVRASLPAGS